MFFAKKRRFTMRFVTKLRMYSAAAVFHGSIKKSTKNPRFLRFSGAYLALMTVSVRVPDGRGLSNSRFLVREGATVY